MCRRRRGPLRWRLPADIRWRFVRAKSTPDRVSQAARFRQFTVGHFTDQRRGYPVCVTGVGSRYVNKWAGLAGERFQQGLDLVELSVVEARPNPADVAETVRTRYPDQQRPDSTFAPTLSFAPATN